MSNQINVIDSFNRARETMPVVERMLEELLKKAEENPSTSPNMPKKIDQYRRYFGLCGYKAHSYQDIADAYDNEISHTRVSQNVLKIHDLLVSSLSEDSQAYADLRNFYGCRRTHTQSKRQEWTIS